MHKYIHILPNKQSLWISDMPAVYRAMAEKLQKTNKKPQQQQQKKSTKTLS